MLLFLVVVWAVHQIIQTEACRSVMERNPRTCVGIYTIVVAVLVTMDAKTKWRLGQLGAYFARVELSMCVLYCLYCAVKKLTPTRQFFHPLRGLLLAILVFSITDFIQIYQKDMYPPIGCSSKSLSMGCVARQWLPHDRVHRDLTDTLTGPKANLNSTQQQQWSDKLRLSEPLRWISGMACICTVGTVACVAVHFVRVLPRTFGNLGEDELFKGIIVLPLFFNFMSLRGLVRIIRVFSGTCLDDKVIEHGFDFEASVNLSMGSFSADLGLAKFAEMCLIVSFGLLCLKYLGNRQAGRWFVVSVVTLFVFAILGFLNAVSLLLLGVGLVQTADLRTGFCVDDLGTLWCHIVLPYTPGFMLDDNFWKANVQRSNRLTSVVSLPVYLGLMYLCGFNAGGLQIFRGHRFVTESLPNSAQKLNGVRLLILVAQVVPAGLGILCELKLLTEYEEGLWKASLMCMACFGMACLHVRWFGDVFAAPAAVNRGAGDCGAAEVGGAGAAGYAPLHG